MTLRGGPLPSFPWQPGTGSQRNAATANPVPAKKADDRSKSGTVLESWMEILSASNTPQMARAIHVPDGCIVRVRAFNGVAAGNSAPILVATYRNAFPDHATALAPLDDVQFQVTNTGQIWVYGAATDGVAISIMNVVSGG